MFPIFTRSKEQKNTLLNVSEAFSLWEMLNSKYGFLERMAVWRAYIHDRDLLFFLDQYRADMQGFVGTLEKSLRQFGINGPDAHTLTAKTTVNSDIIRDQLIATDLLSMVQEHIEMLLVAMAGATTNDQVRGNFIKMVKTDLDQMCKAVKYFKIKGWLYVPPMYPQACFENKTKVDAAEAANLWSHLTYRYDNLQLTQICLAYTNDGDFKIFLELGQKALSAQTRKLEKELNHFGIAFPIKPPAVRAPGEVQSIDDDTLFRIIFSGMTGALVVHSKAIKQSTTNDRVRNLFRDLLLDEMDMFDRAVKYGKMKGWLHPAPSFGVFKDGNK